MPNLTLWGATTSRTIRGHWALRELGLDYRCEPILSRNGDTQTARYTALNPRQKIPTLVDDGFVITESAAIVAYLWAMPMRVMQQSALLRGRISKVVT